LFQTKPTPRGHTRCTRPGNFAFAGSNAFRVDKIVSVNDLLQELINQYQLAEEKGAGYLRDEYEKALERLVSLKEEYIIADANGVDNA